jgi:argininosuccinate lyase
VRGKTGRVYGHLMALLTLMKAQPLAYNRDNQEDKEPLFDTLDTLHRCLDVYAAMMPHIKVRREVMKKAASAGYTTATDLADYLVRKGVPFRDAHAVVGQAVRHAIDAGKDLSELNLEELRRLSPKIEADALAALRLENSVAARNHVGGTAPAQVRAAIARLRERLLQPPA